MSAFPDLHALANSRELAAPVLERMGFLDGDDTTAPRWHVTASGTRITATVTLHAADVGAAKRLAEKRLARDRFIGWDTDGPAEYHSFYAEEA